jgi:uncharacterized protein (TIRG00374 family)
MQPADASGFDGAAERRTAPDRAASRRHRLLIGAKLAISLGLLAWLFGAKIDIADATRRIAAIPPLPFGIVFAALVVSCGLVTARWQLILLALGTRLGFAQAGTITWIGAFFNQTLPSNVGGDFVRVWRALRHGIPLGRAVSSVMLDRALTVAGLAVLVLACLPLSRALTGTGPAWYALPVMAGFILVGLAGLLVLDRIAALLRRLLPSRLVGGATVLAHDARKTLLDRRGLLAIALSAANFTLLSAVVSILARGLGIDIGFGPVLMLFPPVMLVSLLPVSFAGWGVRELAMVTAFGFVGVPDHDAVTLSLAFGLVLLLGTLPGGLLGLATGNRRRAV